MSRRKEVGLRDRDKIIDMKKVGDHFETDESQNAPDMNPFTEYVHHPEAEPEATKPEKGRTAEKRRKQNPITVNPEVKRKRAIVKVKEVLDGAEIVARFFDDTAKRIERINSGK